MGGGGRGCWVRLLLSRNCNRPSSKTEGTFVTPMRDFDVRSPRKSAGRNQTNNLLQDHRRSQDGDSFCFKSWPENLEPSSAARTQMFRGNLSLPDSGWPRFVRMFDFTCPNGWIHKTISPTATRRATRPPQDVASLPRDAQDHPKTAPRPFQNQPKTTPRVVVSDRP